mmetsp:Transcript_73044/g.174200  ORF Transcript_73044/g.174200 Transcript_73044/m.174200 type:complete len:207 (-) Transcript_73044:571-1191(-)
MGMWTRCRRWLRTLGALLSQAPWFLGPGPRGSRRKSQKRATSGRCFQALMRFQGRMPCPSDAAMPKRLSFFASSGASVASPCTRVGPTSAPLPPRSCCPACKAASTKRCCTSRRRSASVLPGWSWSPSRPRRRCPAARRMTWEASRIASFCLWTMMGIPRLPSRHVSGLALSVVAPDTSWALTAAKHVSSLSPRRRLSAHSGRRVA